LPDDIEINSYAGHINQVVTELIENTKIHAFVGVEVGQVVLALRNLGDHVEIEVSDTGRGIIKEFMDQIFDPFFTTRMGRSMGLGLNTVYVIVTRRLGGTIHVTHNRPQGASFVIRLPKFAPTGGSGSGVKEHH